MKLLSKIGMPALMLGAAFLATPAMAQNDENAPSSDNPAAAAAAAPAQPAQDANSAAAPAQSAQDANSPAAAPDTTAMNAQAPSTASSTASSAGNVQLAMNTTGNASDFSSIPNTERKYSRARRGADYRSEAETTKELNEKVSSLNGVSASNAQ
jgi:hypothetical protein